MVKEIITGKTGNGGMFVYMAERETRPQLAQRWFNYGFNDYVMNQARRSSIDYKMQLDREKANDSRGCWVKHWAEYGFNCAILYFEVLDGEGGLNAFKKNPAFLDLIALDFTKEPPRTPELEGIWAGVIEGWQLIRAVNSDTGKFETVYKHKIGEASTQDENEVLDYLVKNKEPVDTEFLGVYYWS